MMKTKINTQFEVIEAAHYGMCFGVKAAIEKAQQLAELSPVTVLGELAHNATVMRNMQQRGAQHGSLLDSAAPTKNVIITAHGAADADRHRWAQRGHRVLDTTCPLVHKAHAALAQLVVSGYAPIVIGKAGHVEVRGLTGDFPQSKVVLNVQDVASLDMEHEKIGIISQTTQQINHVEAVVDAIQQKYPNADIRFIDTVCKPTKERQVALLQLCSKVELVIVVGGKNSNNTAQLANKCRRLGCVAHHVQNPSGIRTEWFEGIRKVGLTSGTSTPDSDIQKVKRYLAELSSEA